MKGTDLLLKIREISPTLPALLLTASAEKRVAHAVSGIGNCELLLKPTDIETVMNAVRRSVSQVAVRVH